MRNRLSAYAEGLLTVSVGFLLGVAFIALDVAGLRWLWVALTAVLAVVVWTETGD